MTPTMRAMVLEQPGGPLVLRSVPVPMPGPGEALVRVGGCAVDRFDLAIRLGARERVRRFPHILGHEIAGEVVTLGDGDGPAPGTRVASSLYLVCGRCRRCRGGRETICERFAGHVGVDIPGGYAEYVTLPTRNLVALPDALDLAEASVLANAVGTAYHALVTRMGVRPGWRVVITGAGGGVGLHAVQVATAAGAAVMAVDVGAAKLDAARRLGADAVVDPTATELTDAILGWAGGIGADGVLELVGPATMPSTLAGLAKGGRMVVVGSHSGGEWPLDPGLLYRNEWEVLGSRNVSVDELRTVVDLVGRGRVRPMIDEVHPLEDAELLHERVRTGAVIGRDVLVP